MPDRLRAALLIAPALAVFLAFFLVPLGQLAVAGGAGGYATILAEPRYLRSLGSTLLVAAATTAITLGIATAVGLFLARARFRGRSTLLALLTLPLAFPGVVVGYLVIMLAGRQGLVAEVSMALGGERIVFAYSLAGLLLGYVYFSIPRTLLTVMAAAEKLDPKLEEAARSLGASSFGVLRDVLLPGLGPAREAPRAGLLGPPPGAGTAFALASRIDVLPMVIYTEFTLQANLAVAAALSFILGLATWAVLALARGASGGAAA
jgi:putative spermidine/putrescine transport system permease protein